MNNNNPPSEEESPTDHPSEAKDSWIKFTHRSREIIDLFSGQAARGGYLAAIDQAVISASNFLATIILARSVSPTELGVYVVGFTALRLTRVIQDGVTIQPLNAFGAPLENSAFKRYATSTGIIQLILAALMAVTAAVGGVVLTRMGNDTAGPAMFALWAPIFWWQLQEYLRRMMYVRTHVLNALIITTISNGIRLGIMLWWAFQEELTGISGLHAIALGSIFAILPGIWQTRSYWSRHFDNVRLTWMRNWGFGKWIVGGNISNWISIEFYPVLTAGLINFAAAGAYRALQNLVAPIHMLLRAIDTYFTPRAAKDFQKHGKKSLSSTLRLIYFIAGIPTLVLLAIALLFSEQLLQFLYGETYLEYSQGIIIMAVFYFLLYITWPLQIVLKASRHSQPIFFANILAALTMFTIGIWAINQWGVYGTIAGQALNVLITAIVLATAWQRFQQRE